MGWLYSILVVGLLLGVWAVLRDNKRFRNFDNGSCAGREWRRRFPDIPKTEIRQFLDIFVDAFFINRDSRLIFPPDKQVMDVYRMLYPPGSMVDGLELETFAMDLEDRYGVDVNSLQRQDITLGDIFEYVVSHRRSQN
jgi:propanediol dehydratase small subunit